MVAIEMISMNSILVSTRIAHRSVTKSNSMLQIETGTWTLVAATGRIPRPRWAEIFLYLHYALGSCIHIFLMFHKISCFTGCPQKYLYIVWGP
jgi:hypothetical protein